MQIAQLHPAVAIAVATHGAMTGRGGIGSFIMAAGGAFAKGAGMIARATGLSKAFKAGRVGCNCLAADSMVLTPDGDPRCEVAGQHRLASAGSPAISVMLPSAGYRTVVR